MRNAGSLGSRGLRSNHSARCAACHSARTNRFMKAGWASSARASDSVTSKAESNSISSVRSPRLDTST